MSILKKLRKRPEPLNVAELAKLLNVTQTTVLRWVRRRQIPCIRVGDTIRFDGAMLGDWIERQAACPQPSASEDYQMRWQELGELAPEDCQTRVIRQEKGSG